MPLVGAGALIVVLGLALALFAAPKIRLGLTIGIFLSSLHALLIPHALIGGCAIHTMACRKVTFPAITVISVLLITGSALYLVYLARKRE
jgi:hypothetical protein